MIWSYRTSDPAKINAIGYHNGDRGSASVNLLGGSETDRSTPPDSQSFFVRNNEVRYYGDVTMMVNHSSLKLLSWQYRKAKLLTGVLNI